MTGSKLAMWRAAIALAHADNRLSNSEQDLLQEYMAAFSFSGAQQRQLEEDIRGGVELDDVFSAVTEPRDRAHLINFARVLFHIDGDFSAAEQRVLEKIESLHIASIDLKGAFQQARREAAATEAAYEKHISEEKAKGSALLRAFGYFARVWDE